MTGRGKPSIHPAGTLGGVHGPRSLGLYVEWLEGNYRSAWARYPDRRRAVEVGRRIYGEGLAQRLGDYARLLAYRRRKGG